MSEELVYDLWNNLSDLSNIEKFDYISNLAKSIKDTGGISFANGMLYTLDDICTEYNICPECGSDLKVKPNILIHNELDFNNIELIDHYVCPYCGWDSRNK